MLTISEIKALAKVAGVDVKAEQWGNGVWEAFITKCFFKGKVVLCVGKPAHTKRGAINRVWEKYIADPNKL